MKFGNKFFLLTITLFVISIINLRAEDKIISTPLINLENLEPSFELEEKNTKESTPNNISLNKKTIKENNSSFVKLIGLDKITAKTTEINLNLGELKRFGPLEIKVLKCGKINSKNSSNNVAYLQVKDLTKNENEKVFIFNGWTFSSDPTLTPFDHAIYDLQLVSCKKV